MAERDRLGTGPGGVRGCWNRAVIHVSGPIADLVGGEVAAAQVAPGQIVEKFTEVRRRRPSRARSRKAMCLRIGPPMRDGVALSGAETGQPESFAPGRSGRERTRCHLL